MAFSERLQQDYLSYAQLASLTTSASRIILRAETKGHMDIADSEQKALELYQAASPRALEIWQYRAKRLKEFATEDAASI